MSRTKPRLLLAADCAVDPAFVRTLEDRLGVEATVLAVDTTGADRSRGLYRHATYFWLALRVLMRRDRYQYIVLWQQFAGLYYSYLARLPINRTKARTIALHLIYRAREGLKGDAYRTVYRGFVRSKSLDILVCHSSREREAYLDAFGRDLDDRVQFVTYGVGAAAEEDDCDCQDEPYYFAGGTSNRDYATLLEAFRGRLERLKVLCFEEDVAGLSVPPNVEVVSGLYGDAFLETMRRSRGVIVTLANPAISSGHLVLLDAMRQGKAVIATRGPCTEDVVDESCALLVRPGSAADVANALDELAGAPWTAQALGQNGRRRYHAEFTVEKYAERIAALLGGEPAKAEVLAGTL